MQNGSLFNPSWSPDGRYLYYTNLGSIDGCFYYSNGTDLYRLDLSDGTTVKVLLPNKTLNLALSPDESAVAYTRANELSILKTDSIGDEQRVVFSEDSNVQAGEKFWWEDGKTVVFPVVYDLCLPDEAQGIVRVDTEDMVATTIVERNSDFFFRDWPNRTQSEIRLLDREGKTWWLEIYSGELAQEE